MYNLRVEGGKTLEGEIYVQGSKNSALPLIAAAMMAQGESVIENCPDILDVREMIDIVTNMGCKCSFEKNTLRIMPADRYEMPDPLKCRNLRASIILMSVLSVVNKEFTLPYPGGCKIGRRPIDYHIDGLSRMGVKTQEKDGMLYGRCDLPTGFEFTFIYPSVGALENLVLAAVLAKGRTVLYNCAAEPEVFDLCEWLLQAGAVIHGIGTNAIVIDGVKKLNGIRYVLPGDRIVAGTYMAACACCGGNIMINNAKPSRNEAVIDVLRRMGCHVFADEDNEKIAVLSEERRKNVPCIVTGPYPEFPTDMQPQLMAVACVGAGTTRIVDKVFENRYATAYELQKMGADIAVNDDGALIYGQSMIYGANVKANDLRSGAALVAAALKASGTTIVSDCEHICRGYENIQRDLFQLGADIQWQEEKKEKNIYSR